MSKQQRLLIGAIPAATAVGGVATYLLLGGAVNRPVTAQATAQLTADQRNVATSLEAAFMGVADTIGPAAVSIEAVTETVPSLRAGGSSGSGRRPSTPQQRSTPGTPREGNRREQGNQGSPGTPSTPGTPGDSQRGNRGGDRSEEPELPFFDFFGPNGPEGGFRFPNTTPRGGTARGSGVIVRADGYILTNDHVVENARGGKVTVTLSDGSKLSGTVLRDARSDLAVVKVNSDKPLPFVRLADSEGVRVGQWAIAIGSPFGQQNTVTTGIISALHRRREITDGGTIRLYPNLIQTDASINPGNSGGPLLNINGEVIGINVAIYSPSGANAGIGYAIPANTAKFVMDQLINSGKVTRGSLGVIPKDVPVGRRKQLGTAEGAYIELVSPDTPAEKAGIQPGDVVVKFAGKPVRDEAALREAAAATTPGTAVELNLLRDGRSLTVTATLTQAEGVSVSEGGGTDTPSRPDSSETTRPFGFEATPLSTELIRQRQLPNGTQGVLIEGVIPGSPAYDANMEAGDIVTSMNGVTVTTVEQLQKALGAVKSGEIASLRVLRRVSAEGRPARAVVDITAP